MSNAMFNFEYNEKRRDPSPGVTAVDESDFKSTIKRVMNAAEFASNLTPDWAEDLLRIARVVYLVDKRALRSTEVSSDRWTREISLSVETVDPDIWRGPPLDTLNSVLQVMTGDKWHVNVHGGASHLDRQYRIDSAFDVDEVALFSGGLDSGSYAVERAHKGDREVMLIGHDPGGASGPQNALYQTIKDSFFDKNDVIMRFQPVGDEPKRRQGRLEGSTRSRGFLFAMTGVFVAAAHGVTKVSVPENGQLALNPPLTPARLGSQSTRSVHPWVIDQFNWLIESVRGNIRIENPYLHYTKGEVCCLANDAELSSEALGQTVSCGTHSAARKGANNCGFCYPCLVRRAGLEKALGEDPTRYGFNLPELAKKKAQHMIDLQQWLSIPFKVTDLIADMPFPESISPNDMMDVIDRGREELRRMLKRHHQYAPHPP